MAGAMKMDWRPYTLKVLWVMYQGFTLEEYDHTSMIVAAVSWSKKSSRHYHPYRQDSSQDKLIIKSNNIGDLARVFLTG